MLGTARENPTKSEESMKAVVDTLKELGVPDSDIAEVAALANSVRDDVLSR